MSDTIKVWYHEAPHDRTCDIPMEIIRGSRLVGSYNDPLVKFQAPHIYASPGFHLALRDNVLDEFEEACWECWDEHEEWPVVVDGYRPASRQEERQKERPDLAVSPDASYHTKGRAVDIRAFNPSKAKYFDSLDPSTWGDLEKIAEVFLRRGWKRPNPREPWHFEWRE